MNWQICIDFFFLIKRLVSYGFNRAEYRSVPAANVFKKKNISHLRMFLLMIL